MTALEFSEFRLTTFSDLSNPGFGHFHAIKLGDLAFLDWVDRDRTIFAFVH